MKPRIKTLFAAGGVLALALFGTAIAGPLEDGAAAYQRGDYATAERLLRPLAEQGDVAAQASLGAMYANGDGVPQDYAQAVVWYRKAATTRARKSLAESGRIYNASGWTIGRLQP